MSQRRRNFTKSSDSAISNSQTRSTFQFCCSLTSEYSTRGSFLRSWTATYCESTNRSFLTLRRWMVESSNDSPSSQLVEGFSALTGSGHIFHLECSGILLRNSVLVEKQPPVTSSHLTMVLESSTHAIHMTKPR